MVQRGYRCISEARNDSTLRMTYAEEMATGNDALEVEVKAVDVEDGAELVNAVLDLFELPMLLEQEVWRMLCELTKWRWTGLWDVSESQCGLGCSVLDKRPGTLHRVEDGRIGEHGGVLFSNSPCDVTCRSTNAITFPLQDRTPNNTAHDLVMNTLILWHPASVSPLIYLREIRIE